MDRRYVKLYRLFCGPGLQSPVHPGEPTEEAFQHKTCDDASRDALFQSQKAPPAIFLVVLLQPGYRLRAGPSPG